MSSRRSSRQLRDEPLPERLGNYRIIDELGRGGMGIVYLAEDQTLGRPVAIKVLPATLHNDPAWLARFEQEARLLAALNHPNIATLHSLEEDGGRRFFTMEYVEGSTLLEHFRRHPLLPDESLGICVQIARALKASHQEGIVHRDLKPANVIITRDGLVKVLDFGLARALVSEGRSGQSTQVWGTVGYMSPEQMAGAEVDHRADNWAFGCILFESLVGRRAFPANDLMSAANLAAQGPNWDDSPAAAPLRPLIEKLLEVDPKRRLNDLTEAIALLESPNALEGVPLELLRSTDRVAVFVQALGRRVRVGDWAAFRVAITSLTDEVVEGRVQLDVDPADWVAGDPARFQLHPFDSTSLVLWGKPQRPGPLKLPEAAAFLRDALPARSPASEAHVVARVSDAPIGRESQLEAIERLAHGFDEHYGVLIPVFGDAGSGKTAFLDHAAVRFRSHGVRDLFGTARRSHGEPLKLFRDLLRDLIGIAQVDDTPAAVRAFARARLVEYLGEDGPLVDYFSGVLMGDEPEVLSEGMRQYRWYLLFAAAARECPIAILIDDLDDSDPEAVQLLHGVLEHCQNDEVPVLAVAAIRSGPGVSETAQSRSMGLVDAFARGMDDSIFLGPLTLEDVARLLDRAYPGSTHRDDVPWLAECLLERSEGNLAFVGELTPLLGRPRSGKPVFRTNDAAQIPQWSVVGIPSRDEILELLPLHWAEAIRDKTEALTGCARELSEYGALMGVEFPVLPLEKLIDDSQSLDQALDLLESLEMVEPMDSKLSRYRFLSRQIPEAILDRMQRSGQRAALSRRRRLAQVVEAEYRDESEWAERIGALHLECGQLSDAFPFLLRALKERISHGQFAAAHALVPKLETAFAALDEVPVREGVEYWRLRAEIFARVKGDQLQGASRAVGKALELARRAGHDDLVASSLIKLMELEIRRSNLEEASRYGDEAMALVDDRFPDLLVNARNNLGILRWHQHRLQDARDVYRETLDKYSSYLSPRTRAKALINLGQVNQDLVRHEEAEQCFEEALSIFEELRDLEFATVGRVGLSNLKFVRGAFEDARDDYLRALEPYRQLQNRRGLARCYHNVSETELRLGALDRALQAIERAIQIRTDLGHVRGQIQSHMLQGSVYWVLGDPLQSEAEFIKALGLATGMGDASLAEVCRVALTLLEVYETRKLLGGLRVEPSYRSEHAEGDLHTLGAFVTRDALALEWLISEGKQPDAEEAARVEALLADLAAQHDGLKFCHLAAAFVRATGAADSQVIARVLDGTVALSDGSPTDWIHEAIADVQMAVGQDDGGARQSARRAAHARAAKIRAANYRQLYLTANVGGSVA